MSSGWAARRADVGREGQERGRSRGRKGKKDQKPVSEGDAGPQAGARTRPHAVRPPPQPVAVARSGPCAWARIAARTGGAAGADGSGPAPRRRARAAAIATLSCPLSGLDRGECIVWSRRSTAFREETNLKSADHSAPLTKMCSTARSRGVRRLVLWHNLDGAAPYARERRARRYRRTPTHPIQAPGRGVLARQARKLWCLDV